MGADLGAKPILRKWEESARSLAGEQSKRTGRSIGLGLRPELLRQLRAQTSGQGPLIGKTVICQ